MFSYKNPDKVLISDFCQVTAGEAIKKVLKMNQNEQKTFLQKRTLCFKKIKPEKINTVKILVELIQNKTMNMFLKQSLEEFIEFSNVIKIFVKFKKFINSNNF